jgi:hypothetical protein
VSERVKWSPALINPSVVYGPAMVTLSGIDQNWWHQGDTADQGRLTLSIAYAGISMVTVRKYEASPFVTLETDGLFLVLRFGRPPQTNEDVAACDAEASERCVNFHRELVEHMQRPMVMVSA